jgi:ankyrin repeat protein
MFSIAKAVVIVACNAAISCAYGCENEQFISSEVIENLCSYAQEKKASSPLTCIHSSQAPVHIAANFLLLAVKKGDIPEVKHIAASIPACVNLHNCFAQTALCVAARKGSADIVRILIAAGAQPNIPSAKYRLVEEDRNNNHDDEYFFSPYAATYPVVEAAYRGNAKIVQLLLAAGADPTLETPAYKCNILMLLLHNTTRYPERASSYATIFNLIADHIASHGSVDTFLPHEFICDARNLYLKSIDSSAHTTEETQANPLLTITPHIHDLYKAINYLYLHQGNSVLNALTQHMMSLDFKPSTLAPLTRLYAQLNPREAAWCNFFGAIIGAMGLNATTLRTEPFLRTPIIHGNGPLIESLITIGARLNSPDNSGLFPLNYVLIHDQKTNTHSLIADYQNILDLLVTHGAYRWKRAISELLDAYLDDNMIVKDKCTRTTGFFCFVDAVKRNNDQTSDEIRATACADPTLPPLPDLPNEILQEVYTFVMSNISQVVPAETPQAPLPCTPIQSPPTS